MSTPARPNILFLMCDQHRADFTGYEGHVTRTPTLDWLAQTGARFRNCYAPNPVCVPCRQAMAVGQLPRTCGVTSFHGDLPPGAMTFAKRFTQYGYRTVCCGKLHHTGLDQMQGWSWRIGEETHFPPQAIDGYVAPDGPPKKPTGGYGPLESALHAGKGVNPVEIVDDYTIVGAENFIRLFHATPLMQSVPPGQREPLLLKVSLIAPHDPFVTADDSYDYYLDRVPLFPPEQPLPEIGGWPPAYSEEQVPPDARRRCLAAYCAMIEHCDRQFTRVLDALTRAGHDLDEWVIIYCSDHGEMLGEKNLWWKFRFYEGAVRVPLLIRAPRLFPAGGVITRNVNLCDLFATLCDIAHLPVPGGLDSRSLLPLLLGRASGWDNESISQLNTDQVMIKRDDLKYIYNATSGIEILFDLAADPRETANAINAPCHRSAVAQFRARAKTLGYPLP
jgi:choline-sulfatase